jgi:membrane fusion protein (multidrug efflux system)
MPTLKSVFVTCLIALAAAGCGSTVEGVPNNRTDGQKDSEILIPVEATTPIREDISSYFETTTRVEAEKRVEVVAKGSGLCLAVSADEGDFVEEGDLIARLETEELEAQIRQSRVSLEQTKFQMETAEEQLREGILSPFEARNARFGYETALATLRMQELQLSYQTIHAPIGGVITLKNIQVGQIVAPGTPIFRIVDPVSYILPIMPPEKELPRLEVGQQARVSIDSVKDREFNAEIRRINPSVDPMSGTIKVVLDFEEEARAYLREGSFARVRLVMETHEDVLLVPKDAVLEENARKYLMIVEEREVPVTIATEDAVDPERAGDAVPEEAGPVNTEMKTRLAARRVEIQTGLEDSDYIEVMTGIGPDTKVVTLGQHTLKPDALVKVTTAQDEIDAMGGSPAGAGVEEDPAKAPGAAGNESA